MKPITGHAPSNQNTVPAEKLTPASTPMRIQKPVGDRLRCGRKITCRISRAPRSSEFTSLSAIARA
jgi:hypothetical protein